MFPQREHGDAERLGCRFPEERRTGRAPGPVPVSSVGNRSVMMTEKRVTLRDVAAAAGVSRATAGFVLSDAPGIAISEATRQRVRETARDLGYVPHSIA